VLKSIWEIYIDDCVAGYRGYLHKKSKPENEVKY
jgi:hypothetical protein